MELPRYPTLSVILEHKKAGNLHFAKSRGQNFLIDRNIARKIAGYVEPIECDTIVEIGPGFGAYTYYLSKLGRRLIVIEQDRMLYDILCNDYRACKNVQVINADILAVGANSSYFNNSGMNRNMVLVGNLPFSISTRILFHWLDELPGFHTAIFTFQQEISDRIMAPPGSKNRSVLSVVSQYYLEIQHLFNIKKSCFYPAPRVLSSVLLMKRRAKKYPEALDEGYFKRIIKSLFAFRRKKLINSLLFSNRSEFKRCHLEDILAKLGIDPNRRSETLTVEETVRLCNEMYQVKKKLSGK